jgi:hypothetical protein
MGPSALTRHARWRGRRDRFRASLRLEDQNHKCREDQENEEEDTLSSAGVPLISDTGMLLT